MLILSQLVHLRNTAAVHNNIYWANPSVNMFAYMTVLKPDLNEMVIGRYMCDLFVADGSPQEHTYSHLYIDFIILLFTNIS